MLGTALNSVLPSAGFKNTPIDIDDVDITDREAVLHAVKILHPNVIINAAAVTNVDGCEGELKEKAFAVNGAGAGNVAAAAESIGALTVHISTDFVFDGWKGTPYTETDRPNPQSVYANSKLAGERAVAAETARYFIVRTAWMYGPGGRNFVDTIARLAQDREELSVVDDQTGCPTYTIHLAAALASMIRKHLERNMGRPGVYHVTGAGYCTWCEFARKIVEHRPGKVKKVNAVTAAEYGLPAPRPAWSVLSNEKVKKTFGVALPHWEDALAEYLA